MAAATIHNPTSTPTRATTSSPGPKVLSSKKTTSPEMTATSPTSCPTRMSHRVGPVVGEMVRVVVRIKTASGASDELRQTFAAATLLRQRTNRVGGLRSLLMLRGARCRQGRQLPLQILQAA